MTHSPPAGLPGAFHVLGLLPFMKTQELGWETQLVGKDKKESVPFVLYLLVLH